MTKFLSFIGVVGLLVLAVLGLMAITPAAQAPLNAALNDIASQVGQAQTIAEAQQNWVMELQAIPDTVQVSQHAIAKHPEAAAIIACAKQNGFYQTWRDTLYKSTFYGICQIPDGRWGLATFNKSLKNNNTAFCPGSGTWDDIMKYLTKLATRWNKGIPIQ